MDGDAIKNCLLCWWDTHLRLIGSLFCSWCVHCARTQKLLFVGADAYMFRRRQGNSFYITSWCGSCKNMLIWNQNWWFFLEGFNFFFYWLWNQYKALHKKCHVGVKYKKLNSLTAKCYWGECIVLNLLQKFYTHIFTETTSFWYAKNLKWFLKDGKNGRVLFQEKFKDVDYFGHSWICIAF